MPCGDGGDRERTAPFADFTSASLAVVHALREQTGLRLWMVTRVAGEELGVLTVADEGYGLAAGTVFGWSGSLCHQMVSGAGPRAAPDVGDVPAYADAQCQESLPVRAYLAAPLLLPDGALFGTLCGLDWEPHPASLAEVAPLVDLQARLLSTVLALDLASTAQRRRAERAEAEACVDPLTGVMNRRAWDRVLADEEARCGRYGHPACVLVFDLNGLKEVNDTRGHDAGDQVISRAAELLCSSVRYSDPVARLGGDEFGVLAVETDLGGGRVEAQRLQTILDAEHIAVAVGVGARTLGTTMLEAWRDADRAMYAQKRDQARARLHSVS